jgi:hypothetical protein
MNMILAKWCKNQNEICKFAMTKNETMHGESKKSTDMYTPIMNPICVAQIKSQG